MVTHQRDDHGAIEGKKYKDPKTGQPIERSPKWPDTEKAHLKKEPVCQCCTPQEAQQHKDQVQVHHMFPFHYCIALGRPDLELDDRNLITLCETEKDHPTPNHHLLVGHLDSFQSSNLEVATDARKTFHGMSAAQIKGNAGWLKEVKARLKPLDQMTPGDKKSFTDLMNQRIPKR